MIDLVLRVSAHRQTVFGKDVVVGAVGMAALGDKIQAARVR